MTAKQIDNRDQKLDSRSVSAASQRTKGMRQFAIGMFGYAVIVMLQNIFVEPQSVSTWLAVLLAAAPIAVAVWAMAGWLSAVRTFDELRQKIFAESGLISLGITAVATFTYGFLENLAGLPKLSMFFVFPFMAFCYSLSLPLVMRRYG